MPGRGSLTRGRSGAGVLGHLVLVVQIFRIRNSAVCSNLNLGVLYVLEAEFLQERKQVDQKPEIYRQ
jgi:hypothetical protein